MIDMTKKIYLILHLLDEVIADRKNPSEALKEWPDPNSTEDKLLASSWHDLSHYAVDVDIRTKDVNYDYYMKGLLRKNAGEIREKYREILI
jgi:hypothetical protein